MKLNIILFCICSNFLLSQNDFSPEIFISDITDYSDKFTKVQISSSLINDAFAFEKSSSNFQANYDYSIVIRNSTDKTVFSQVKTKQIIVESYKNTNTDDLAVYHEEIVELPEDQYQITVLFFDINSKLSFKVTEQITVKDPVSEIQLLSKLRFYSKKGDDRQSIDDQRFLDTHGNLEVEFYCYNPNKLQNLKAMIRVESFFNDVLYEKEIASIIFDQNQRAILFDIIDPELLRSDYLNIYVELIHEEEVIAELEDRLALAWDLMPNSKKKMREALNQMRYVLDTDSIDKYKDEPLVISQSFFNRFWYSAAKEQNETDLEALKREYFRRVNYANTHFNIHIDIERVGTGWRTDRGRVYIKYGPPDRIAHPKYNVMIWIYRELGYQIKFVYSDYKKTYYIRNKTGPRY